VGDEEVTGEELASRQSPGGERDAGNEKVLDDAWKDKSSGRVRVPCGGMPNAAREIGACVRQDKSTAGRKQVITKKNIYKK